MSLIWHLNEKIRVSYILKINNECVYACQIKRVQEEVNYKNIKSVTQNDKGDNLIKFSQWR
jgi:hypothetical protein